MELDDKFEKIRDLKEDYITFNNRHVNDPDNALIELDDIIVKYESSGIALFREVAETLKEHRKAIANSFIYIEDSRRQENNGILRRLSNGPMEGFNVFPKSLKRNSRGVSNFEYTRNRILWATRNNPTMLGVPKSLDDIANHTGKHRGKYNKK